MQNKEDNEIEYHTPDRTWEIWCDSYKNYIKIFVVKARFHPSVPTDILNSYKTVEYIMAHAYYYYPIYDEAILRLTGIFEMAIKIRCKELNIPLEEYNDKNELLYKRLAQLIKDVNKVEPGKQLHFQLNRLRELCNSLAHPNRYGFSGGMINATIQHTVNVLNQLFLPESFLISFTKERKRIAAQAKMFSKNIWVLTYQGLRFLVHNCKITLAILSDNDWKYLLVAYPVYKDFEAALSNNRYERLFVLSLSDIKIKKDELLATDIQSGLSIMINKSSKKDDTDAYQKHLLDWEKADKIKQTMYNLSMDSEIGKIESDLYYQWLSLVKF